MILQVDNKIDKESLRINSCNKKGQQSFCPDLLH